MEVYRHQVGGHSQLMKPQDSSKVYKPFTESEFRFYDKLASLGATATDSGPLHVLRQFVPKYFGVTEVQVQTACSPHAHFSAECARINRRNSSQTRNNCTVETSCIGLANKGRSSRDEGFSAVVSMTEESRMEGSLGVPNKRVDYKNRTEDVVSSCGPTNSLIAPSSSSSSLSSSNCSSTVLKYIVLEDLVYQYKKPCVMDLKMGKRQRKIGASSEKKRRQLEKSLETTSHEVGFRLCGMQFYDEKNGVLCYRDKYWGRKLTKDTLRDSIGQWFWDGNVSCHELLLPLMNSLKILHACISKLRYYRFWSSSLLWVFDGGLTDANARLASLDVRMIDFANTIVLKDNPGPDDEYLFGLGNLISILESLVSTCLLSETYASVCQTKLPSRPSSAQLAVERSGDSSDGISLIEDDERDYREQQQVSIDGNGRQHV